MDIQPDLIPSSYRFNIVNHAAIANYVYITSIGYENRKQTDPEKYAWDCRVELWGQEKEQVCIFQYTVSGEGAIEINNKIIRLKPGSIFMIERPGPYRYWLPEDSDHWELKFLEFSTSTLPIWNTITQSFGRVFSMNETGPVIRLWNKIYSKTENGEIDNVYDNALYGYSFLLGVHKYLSEFGARSKNAEAIQKCIDYIKENFVKDITITDIAYAGGISPFYLNKTFKEMLGETPMHYVIKMRVKYSMGLLYNSDMTLEAIATKSGFQNANYFSKVFKKYVDMSPTEFRRQHLPPVIL